MDPLGLKRAAEEALARARKNHAQMVTLHANNEMNKIATRYLSTGEARSVQEAVKMTCDRHGRQQAALLQDSLRSLGALDITVTCP